MVKIQVLKNGPVVDVVGNAFCPMGKGGGIDPSCGGGKGAGGSSGDREGTHKLLKTDMKGLRAKRKKVEAWSSSVTADGYDLPKGSNLEKVVKHFESKGWKSVSKKDFGTDSWKWRGADVKMSKGNHSVNVSFGSNGRGGIYVET